MKILVCGVQIQEHKFLKVAVIHFKAQGILYLLLSFLDTMYIYKAVWKQENM